jgi:hypothetical protein
LREWCKIFTIIHPFTEIEVPESNLSISGSGRKREAPWEYYILSINKGRIFANALVTESIMNIKEQSLFHQ